MKTTLKTLVVAGVAGLALMVSTVTPASAASVTASVCNSGGGHVQTVQQGAWASGICIGGMYDGAEVW